VGYGIGAGMLWALETIVLSVLLMKGTFVQTEQAVFLAPFISAFLNDTLSGLWLLAFRKANKSYRTTTALTLLSNKNGRLLILSGLFGGPLGMSSYLLSIKYIGASYTAVISALYPAFGSILAWLFLKDKLTRGQLAGIGLCAFGVIGMTGTPQGSVRSFGYFAFAFACAVFWGLEAVISSRAMRNADVPYEAALQIRHTTSTLCYAFIFLPLLKAWSFTLEVLTVRTIVLLLLLTALLETGSYLMYYKAIHITGAARAMSLNITYMIWSVLFSIIIFKELPGKYELISIAILLAGVLLVVKCGKDRAAQAL
jgi:drug/metabolite transporter (DMT)-like permease